MQSGLDNNNNFDIEKSQSDSSVRGAPLPNLETLKSLSPEERFQKFTENISHTNHLDSKGRFTDNSHRFYLRHVYNLAKSFEDSADIIESLGGRKSVTQRLGAAGMKASAIEGTLAFLKNPNNKEMLATIARSACPLQPGWRYAEETPFENLSHADKCAARYRPLADLIKDNRFDLVARYYPEQDIESSLLQSVNAKAKYTTEIFKMLTGKELHQLAQGYCEKPEDVPIPVAKLEWWREKIEAGLVVINKHFVDAAKKELDRREQLVTEMTGIETKNKFATLASRPSNETETNRRLSEKLKFGQLNFKSATS